MSSLPQIALYGLAVIGGLTCAASLFCALVVALSIRAERQTESQILAIREAEQIIAKL